MANVLIRNMPDDLYARLRERAARERRSVPAEVMRLVESALVNEVVREPVATYAPEAKKKIGPEDVRRKIAEARNRPKVDPREAWARIIERSQRAHPERFDSLEALREDRAR